MYVGVWGCWYWASMYMLLFYVLQCYLWVNSVCRCMGMLVHIYIYNVKPCTTLRGQTGRKVVFTCLTHHDKTKPVTSYILTTLHSQKNNTYDIDNDKNESLTWRSSHSHAHKLINYRTKLGKLYIYILLFWCLQCFLSELKKQQQQTTMSLNKCLGCIFLKNILIKEKSQRMVTESKTVLCAYTRTLIYCHQCLAHQNKFWSTLPLNPTL